MLTLKNSRSTFPTGEGPFTTDNNGFTPTAGDFTLSIGNMVAAQLVEFNYEAMADITANTIVPNGDFSVLHEGGDLQKRKLRLYFMRWTDEFVMAFDYLNPLEPEEDIGQYGLVELE